jgi:hypothetical protein
MHSDYLRDAEADDGAVNFSDLGIQLTRSTRAFKLWLSLRTFGVDAFRGAIDHTLDLAELAQRRIDASESLELAAPPSLGIVCFFRRGADDKQTDGLAAALEQSGLGFTSTTRVHGRTALRLCILNHTTRAEDVECVLEFLETAEPRRPTREYERHEQVPTTVPLFARLDPLEARAFAALSTEREIATGAAVVSRWDTSRDFYVIEEGLVDVLFDDELVATLRPGDYFGEIAALEWGARFARSRIATVIVRRNARLRVLEPAALHQLLEEFPRLESEIRHTAHRRMRETL